MGLFNVQQIFFTLMVKWICFDRRTYTCVYVYRGDWFNYNWWRTLFAYSRNDVRDIRWRCFLTTRNVVSICKKYACLIDYVILFNNIVISDIEIFVYAHMHKLYLIILINRYLSWLQEKIRGTSKKRDKRRRCKTPLICQLI